MTIDTILRSDIRVCQPKIGFRFSAESVILPWFATLKKNDNVLDIGSGSGIISVLIAKFCSTVKITAIELQQQMFECLLKTIEINNLQNIITAENCDAINYRSKLKFDLIISNPPYRPKNIGRVCNNDIENNARFTNTLSNIDLMETAAANIKNKGKLVLCGDADRLAEIMYLLKQYKFEPKRLMFLHSDYNKVARLYFLESVFYGGIELKVEPPLFQNSGLFNNIMNGNWSIK